MTYLETKWKIKFYLEKRIFSPEESATDRKIPIYMFVTFGKGERLQFYTRELVHADHFDEDYLKKVKEDRCFFRPVKPQVADSRSINGRLEVIAKEVVRFIELAGKSDPPVGLSAKYLKAALKSWIDKDTKPSIIEKGMTLAEAMDEYKIYIELHLAPKTVSGFKQVRDNVEAFIKILKIKDIGLSDINQGFVDGFETFLIKKKMKNGENYSNNTYAKNQKKLNTFLLWCKSKGWFAGGVRIKWKENPGAILFVTKEEFKKLEEAKFDDVTHDRVRDVFVFGTMTGLRYGQLKELKKSDYNDDHINYHDHKKGAFIQRTIKLVPKALAVVEKYKDWPGKFLLPAVANPNKKLKEVFVKAEIERQVKKVHKYAGGKVKEEVMYLSQLAHSHMERKTFITLGLEMGIPDAVLKSITGHTKDSAAFNRYHEFLDSMKDDAMDATFGKL